MGLHGQEADVCHACFHGFKADRRTLLHGAIYGDTARDLRLLMEGVLRDGRGVFRHQSRLREGIRRLLLSPGSDSSSHYPDSVFAGRPRFAFPA